MAGQKKSQDIQKKLRDFPNITLAGLELAIVVKRHLLLIYLHRPIDQVLQCRNQESTT